MMFDPDQFPKYSLLSVLERFFLRSCCYFPPRPRRQPEPQDLRDLDKFTFIYQSAFGKELWSWIQAHTVIDLGCGEGGYVLALAAQGAKLALGLDIQSNFLHAQHKAQEDGLNNAAFLQAELAALKDNSFDIIISHDSFEHFHDPQAVLADMTRVVHPGGLLLIKFGPPWKNPWGRHMSGTIRKDRPWVHLLFSEKTIMRCHSVYHNTPEIRERYEQLPGGLNRMTLARFQGLLKSRRDLEIQSFQVKTLFGNAPIVSWPGVKEFFASSVSARCMKKKR